MTTSLSSLLKNLSEGFNNDKCIDCKSYLVYMPIKDDQQSCTQLIFRFFKCKMNHKKDFNKALITRFASTYKFCDEDINKFILLLRNGVYPYEYMDSWGRFDETSLPNKEDFYSSLNIEEITDIDYRHAKEYLKFLIIKILAIVMIYMCGVINY